LSRTFNISRKKRKFRSSILQFEMVWWQMRGKQLSEGVFELRMRGKEKCITLSHIPQFGDAASPTGDVDVSAGDAHL
jgi:hypothetical protein